MMKRILAILCSVILVVTCCVMVGCDDKETYEMSLMVHCASALDETNANDVYYVVYNSENDTFNMQMFGVSKKYFTLAEVRVDGFKYCKDYIYLDQWHPLNDFYDIKLGGSWWHDGLQRSLYPEGNSFCIDRAGYYEMQWTLTPKDADLQKNASREIWLYVYVYD